MMEKSIILDYLNNPKIRESDLKDIPDLEWIIKQINEKEYIPVTGDTPPKRCVFLSGSKLCVIYQIRPKICIDYPLEVVSSGSSGKIRVDLGCPRSKQIIKELKKGKYPDYIKDEINFLKKIKVEDEHFFDEKMSDRD